MPGKTIRKALDALRRPMSLWEEVNNAARLLCNLSTVKSAFSFLQLLAKTPANEPSASFLLHSINNHLGSPHNHYRRALRRDGHGPCSQTRVSHSQINPTITQLSQINLTITQVLMGWAVPGVDEVELVWKQQQWGPSWLSRCRSGICVASPAAFTSEKSGLYLNIYIYVNM